MKTSLVFASFIAVTTIVSVPDLLAAEAKLRAISFQGEAVSFAKPFYRWIRETNQRCAGQIEITVSGPEDIPSPHQWYALKNGEVDMYFGPANYYRGALPEGDVFNLAHNEPAEQRRNGAWKLLNSLHNEKMNAWYLTTLSAGVKFFLYTTKSGSNGRFDGFRLRGVPLYEKFLKSLGAETHYMPASGVRAALENKTLDGYGWPLWSGGLGWEKFAKFRYGPGFLNTASPVLVNLDRWKSLNDGQRRCLTEMALWVEGEWANWREAENARQLASLRDAKIEYVDLGAEFKNKAESVYWGMLKQALPDFVRKIRPLVQPE